MYMCKDGYNHSPVLLDKVTPKTVEVKVERKIPEGKKKFC